jgi:hypothetical protein
MGEAAAGAPAAVPSQDDPAPFIRTARDPTDAERNEIMSILTAKSSAQPIGVRMYDWMKKNPGVRFDGVVTPTWRRDGYTFGGLNAIMLHVNNIEHEELAYADPRDRRFLKEALTLMPDPRRKNPAGNTATKILQDSVARMRQIRSSRLPYAEKDLKMLLDYEKEYPLLISGLPDGPAPAPAPAAIVPVPSADPAGLVDPTEDQRKVLRVFIDRMTMLQRQRPYEEAGFPTNDDPTLWTAIHEFLNANPTLQIRGPDLKTNPASESLLSNVATAHSPNSVPLFHRLLQKKPVITGTSTYPIGNSKFLSTTIGGILKHFETDAKTDKQREVFQAKIRLLATYEADPDGFVAREIAPIQIVVEPVPVVGPPTLRWPEVACIMIGSHGCYVKNTEPVKPDASNLVKHIKIPKGMTLHKITAVGPGCINWIWDVESQLFLQYAGHIFQTSDTTEAALPKIRDLLRMVEGTDVENAIFRMIEDSKVPGKRKPTKKSMEEFRYRLITYTDGEDTLEKWFHRSPEEAEKGWGIFQINGPPGDLIPVLARPGKTGTFKSEILQFFAKKGTRHLVMIDRSCCGIEDTDPETRSLFREYVRLTRKNGGRRKPRKTRRNRKTKRATRKTK